MSRLYEALKGANRSRQKDEDTAEPLWQSLGIAGNDVHDGDEDSELSAAPASASTTTETVVSGEIGKPTEATPDTRSRLIPNAIDPSVAEHYRKLRTKIVQQKAEKGFRSLVVTSASPQEGKSVTVLNLGLSFGMLPDFKVLVVDGDMRKGTLGKWLEVDPQQPGLSNLIDRSARLEEVVLTSDQLGMSFITRGNSRVPDLHSSQLRAHFQEMTEKFDLVLVDSPPVNLVADVQLLATNCDAVLLVARAFFTSRKAYEKAIADLSPFKIIGAVLNAGVSDGYRYHKYY